MTQGKGFRRVGRGNRAYKAFACLALLSGGSVATAQDSTRAGPATRDSATTRPLLTSRDAVVGAGFAVATVAAFPLDRRITHSLRTTSAQSNRFIDRSGTALELLTIPGVYIADASLYVVGRMTHSNTMTDVAVHSGEAVVVSDGVAEVIKILAGRARPSVSADTNPGDFRFGSGLTGDSRQSFPSAHATNAFAAASAITAELGRHRPRTSPLVGAALYAGATLVAISRVYHNDHWASDVAIGAAIGTFSGQKVVQYTHDHPRNAIDELLRHIDLFPGPGGNALVSWSSSPVR